MYTVRFVLTKEKEKIFVGDAESIGKQVTKNNV